MSPAVSVLMPVYNTAAYLREAVESVLSQTFDDFELVIIDDGSSDASPRLLEQLRARDRRIRLTLRDNRGLIATRNELLEIAQGEFVAWMDSDDISVPDRLARQIEAVRRRPELVCLGGSILHVDPEGAPIQRLSFPESDAALRRELRMTGPFCFGTMIMRRAIVRDVGGFRMPFLMGEDYDLVQRLAEQGELGNLPDVLLHYRMRLESTSHRLATHWPRFRDLALELARERRELGSDRLQRGESVELELGPANGFETPLFETHVRWARQALQQSYRRTAWKHAVQAARRQPLSTTTWRLFARIALNAKPSTQ